jgi:Cytochrome bd terminal oxidase subunit I
MEFDALLLARMQFAFTVAFHIVFPAFSIGLASYLAVLEGLWFLALWLIGIGVLGVVAYLLRGVLKLAGG